LSHPVGLIEIRKRKKNLSTIPKHTNNLKYYKYLLAIRRCKPTSVNDAHLHIHRRRIVPHKPLRPRLMELRTGICISRAPRASAAQRSSTDVISDDGKWLVSVRLSQPSIRLSLSRTQANRI